MKLALREDTTPGDSLAEQVAWLARVGLEGIELNAGALDLPVAELRAIFADSPVGVASLDGTPKLLHPDPAERAMAKEVIRRRLDLAGELGATGVLVVPQFGRSPELPDLAPFLSAVELATELLVRQLAELLPAATAAGARLCLEPLNRYQAYLVNRLEQAVAIAERVGPGIGVMADFFHMNIEEANVPAAIRTAGRRLVHVHVADNNRLRPGRGQLDFRPGFAALKEIGYDGWLGLECLVAGEREEAIGGSAALLREWWAAA